MGVFVAETGVPDEAVLVSCKVQRVVEESVVGLIFGTDCGFHFSLRKGRGTVQD